MHRLNLDARRLHGHECWLRPHKARQQGEVGEARLRLASKQAGLNQVKDLAARRGMRLKYGRHDLPPDMGRTRLCCRCILPACSQQGP